MHDKKVNTKPTAVTQATSKNVALATEFHFTQDERAMLSSFRKMNDSCRANILRASQAFAERWPQQPSPKLQLVYGGAK